MSVNVDDRSQGNFPILESIRKLRDYTLDLCDKEKYFGPDSYNLAEFLKRAVIEAQGNILGAYGTVVYSKKDLQDKLQFCSRAHANLRQMLAYLEVCKDHYTFITERRELYWTGLIARCLEDLQILVDFIYAHYR